MAFTYCFKCGVCGLKVVGAKFPNPEHLVLVQCIACGTTGVWKRDYRAEQVGVDRTSTRTTSADKDLFLPTYSDFKGPKDPDGTKGMREWNETHQPHSSNKNPVRPGDRDIKKVF